VSLLRFSVFELDPGVPELRRSGRRVHLQEMPLRVLQMVLEHPHELVPREAFFARLWPNDKTGILDDNLNTAVRKLRLALNDSAHHPRFIETVPKRGYRFIGPLIENPATPGLEVPAPLAVLQADPTPPIQPVVPHVPILVAQPAKRRLYIFIAAPMILALVALGFALRNYESLPPALMGQRIVEGGATSATPVADTVAYDHYLKGRFHWHRRTQEGLRTAATHFEAAVAHAPMYAPAWAGLADAYAVLGFYDFLPPTEAFPKAQEAARRALELDPKNASAEATMGYVALYYQWNIAKAETRFRRAIALEPNNTKAHQWYGNLLTAAGRFEEAEREMRHAQQLEPLSMIASAARGWALYHAGRHEDALEQYRITLTLDPNFELAYLWSGWALEALGRYDDALSMLEDAAKRSGGSGICLASLARVRALRGERTQAEHILMQLQSSKDYVPAYEISKAWFALGASAAAEEWLQRAFEQRSHSLVFLRVDPQLAKHRQEPAFKRIAARVGS
jgi:DNA-binding winged helix-turn-helix (wHTH) protein/tetratricopeptide (TPR) repeat protein